MLRLYDNANSNSSGISYHFSTNTTNWLVGSVSGTVYANQTRQNFGIANDNPDYQAVVNDVLGTTIPTGSVGGWYGLALSGSADALYSAVYYYFAVTYNLQTMPTYSIEGGSVFQANSTADNTTYQHYQAFGEDSTNLTEGEYNCHKFGYLWGNCIRKWFISIICNITETFWI